MCARAADAPPTTVEVRAAMRRAVEFLLKEQNPDGSWGSPRNASDEFWSNPETHRSWIVATTGLCCMALRDAGPDEVMEAAYDRGIDYILQNALVKRPSDWDVDNTWGYTYGLQALARAARLPKYAETSRAQQIREVAGKVLDKLSEYQTPSNGWGYYDFDGPTRTPSWATSFMTAATILALLDARDASIEVPPKMLERAVRGVRRCRLPSGAYTYSIEAIPTPRHSEWIDQVKGSLGRIQVCNLALRRAGQPISDEQLTTGLGHFFHEHRFLDIARQRPIPHEAYYYNAGYFYYFGHYYAAGVIAELPSDERAAWWGKLQHEIIKTQEKDGCMWDYYMNSYHKPYGTAFGLMTLARSLADVPEPRPNRAAERAD